MSTIIGIELSERNKDSVKLQKILTKYGCNISIRIGLHCGTEEDCSASGLIIINVTGNSAELINILQAFWKIHFFEY